MGSLGHCIIWKQVGQFRCFYQIEVRSVFTEKNRIQIHVFKVEKRFYSFIE